MSNVDRIPKVDIRAESEDVVFRVSPVGGAPSLDKSLTALVEDVGASRCGDVSAGAAEYRAKKSSELRELLVFGGIDRLRSVADVTIRPSAEYGFLYEDVPDFSVELADADDGSRFRLTLQSGLLDEEEVASLLHPGSSVRRFARVFATVDLDRASVIRKSRLLLDFAGNRAELDGRGAVLLPRQYRLFAEQLFFGDGEAAMATCAATRFARSLGGPSLPAFPKGRFLLPHQVNAFNWMWKAVREFGGGIVADDMGLGKTVEAIAWSKSALESGFVDRVLVVAPKSVLENWFFEWSSWAPEVGARVISGSRTERIEALRSANERVVIIGYESAVKDQAQIAKAGFEAIILDEGHRTRNEKTKTHVAMKAVASGAKARFILSGTPFVNGVSDLFSEVELACPWYVPGSAKARKRVEELCKQGDENAVAALAAWLDPIMLRRRREDVIDGLPEKTSETVVVRLEGEQREIYDRLRQRMELIVRSLDGEEYVRRFQSLFQMLTTLRQAADHPALVERMGVGGSAKLDKTLELTRRFVGEGGKVIVYTEFLGMHRIIECELERMGLSFHSITGETGLEERQAQAESWESDDVPVFLVSRAGGEGVNLAAGDAPVAVIRVDPWWNRAVDDQVVGRAWRLGQRAPVRDFALVAAGTVDERVVAVRDEKAAVGAGVVEGQGAKLFLSKEEFLQLLEPIDEG